MESFCFFFNFLIYLNLKRQKFIGDSILLPYGSQSTSAPMSCLVRMFNLNFKAVDRT